VGLAKEKENVAGDKLIDRVYLPGQKNAIGLKPNAPELFLLARARDEAHRFANRMRSKAGKRRRLASSLEGIAGIGPKTQKLLLKHLGGPERLRHATAQELLAISGVTARHVRALRAYFSAPAPSPAVSTEPDARVQGEAQAEFEEEVVDDPELDDDDLIDAPDEDEAVSADESLVESASTDDALAVGPLRVPHR
jgi:NAD-dependent DNA ligase